VPDVVTVVVPVVVPVVPSVVVEDPTVVVLNFLVGEASESFLIARFPVVVVVLLRFFTRVVVAVLVAFPSTGAPLISVSIVVVAEPVVDLDELPVVWADATANAKIAVIDKNALFIVID
jgi:hypothetical protein